MLLHILPTLVSLLLASHKASAPLNSVNLDTNLLYNNGLASNLARFTDIVYLFLQPATAP